MANTKKKFTLSDVSRMMWDQERGTNKGSVDANSDGKKDSADIDTMMKLAAGWSEEAAKDPYRGKEITPSGYADKQAYLLGKVTDRQPFSFSGGGALYDAYAKAYKREGDLAAKDTLSKVSARTGGVPSSYAVTATAAQQNQYAAALADKIPELYSMELDKYYKDADLARADLSTLMGVKSQDLSEAYTAAAAGDYSLLEGMGIDTTKLRSDAAWNEALKKAEYGDYSGLQAMGVDMTKLLREQELQEAYAAAEVGDWSKLAALGIDTTQAMRSIQLEEAYAAAEMGDYSKLQALGVDTSFLERQKQAQLGSLTSSGTSSPVGSNLTFDDYGDIMDNIEFRLVYDKEGEKVVDTSKAYAYIDMLVNSNILSATEGYTLKQQYAIGNEYTTDRKEWTDDQFEEYYGAIAEEGTEAAESEILNDYHNGIINLAQFTRYLKMVRGI